MVQNTPYQNTGKPSVNTAEDYLELSEFTKKVLNHIMSGKTHKWEFNNVNQYHLVRIVTQDPNLQNRVVDEVEDNQQLCNGIQVILVRDARISLKLTNAIKRIVNGDSSIGGVILSIHDMGELRFCKINSDGVTKPKVDLVGRMQLYHADIVSRKGSGLTSNTNRPLVNILLRLSPSPDGNDVDEYCQHSNQPCSLVVALNDLSQPEYLTEKYLIKKENLR